MVPVKFQPEGHEAIRKLMTEFRLPGAKKREMPPPPPGRPDPVDPAADSRSAQERRDAIVEAGRKARERAFGVDPRGSGDGKARERALGAEARSLGETVTVPVRLDFTAAREEMKAFRKELRERVGAGMLFGPGGAGAAGAGGDAGGDAGGGRGSGRAGSSAGGTGGHGPDRVDEQLKRMRQLADENLISSRYRRQVIRGDVDLARQEEHLKRAHGDPGCNGYRSCAAGRRLSGRR